MMLILIVLAVVGSSYSTPPKLIWVERFDVFDQDAWTHFVSAWGGGNNEFQYYRNNRNNSYVKDGYLHIRPTFTADEYGDNFLTKGVLAEPGCDFEPCKAHGSDFEIVPPVLSAKLTTKRSFSFKYGRIEVRAKMPRGDWIWPAIWMQPLEDVYGTWPKSGEIDIVEIRSNQELKNEKGEEYGIRKKTTTMHFGVDSSKWPLTHWETLLNDTEDFSDDFHTFGMEWTNKSICFILDGVETGRVTPPQGGFWEYGKLGPRQNNIWKNGGRMAPFDQKFYISLNVAIGGNFFPSGWKNAGKRRPWTDNSRNQKKQFWAARDDWMRTWDRPEMLVDHILVYGWD